MFQAIDGRLLRYRDHLSRRIEVTDDFRLPHLDATWERIIYPHLDRRRLTGFALAHRTGADRVYAHSAKGPRGRYDRRTARAHDIGRRARHRFQQGRKGIARRKPPAATCTGRLEDGWQADRGFCAFGKENGGVVGGRGVRGA